jgi:hypothetical protein
MNIFQGGFLGLDNIGVFDRSAPLPTGGYIEQSDGTSWMAMYTLNLLAIALELAKEEKCYEDVASKFWEHFIYIAHAMSHRGHEGMGLWNEQDGFYYDVLRLPDGRQVPLQARSIVGLLPLAAVSTLGPDTLARMPDFAVRLRWFTEHRREGACVVHHLLSPDHEGWRMCSLVSETRLRRLLAAMLDPAEFLSDHGLRALSKRHALEPLEISVDGVAATLDYEPGESTSGLFGGNSNWRGPVWMPINFLLVEALRVYHRFFGDAFRIECPTGSGRLKTLDEVADELSRRLVALFLRDADGRRPVLGDAALLQEDPAWRDLIPFHEYFHGDSGAGLGASHQTGWTGLVANLIVNRHA